MPFQAIQWRQSGDAPLTLSRKEEEHSVLIEESL